MVKETGKISTPAGMKDHVDMVWLAMSFSRSWQTQYQPGAAQQAAPLCFSKNGKEPHGGTAAQKTPCHLCPKSAWHGNVKPECGEIYKLLCLDLEHFVPFTLTVKRTGIKSVKMLSTTMDGLDKKAARQYKAHLCHAVRLKAGKDKAWYIPVFQVLGTLEDKAAKYNQDMARRLVSILANQAADEGDED